jgi:ribonuclease P protein component
MTADKPLTFPQSRRMKTPAEFDRCYKRKRSASDAVLIVYACENDLAHPRLGCSVSKKVGNAVVRNRYKRLFREAFRLTQHDLPAGVDLVLIPRPGPEPTLAALKESLVKLATQAAKKLGDGKRPDPQPSRSREPVENVGEPPAGSPNPSCHGSA